MNGPTGLMSGGGDDIVRVGMGGEEEVAVLVETGKHTAGDGPPVLLLTGASRRLEKGREEEIPSHETRT